MSDSTQKHALIVGGSSGMGKESAKRLLAAGHSVLLLARNAEKLQAAKDELSPLGDVKTVTVDLSTTLRWTDSFNRSAKTRNISPIWSTPPVRFAQNHFSSMIVVTLTPITI